MTSEAPSASISDAPPVTEELPLSSWEEYRPAIAAIERRYGSHDKGDGRSHENRIAYRGQKSARWALETTLEREGGPRRFTVHQYYERATRHHREMESITGRTWLLPGDAELKEKVTRNTDSLHVSAPAYPYLVYLRHHGFPSPFLDWSLSAYVAAFFAFESADQTKDERVAVYAYVDTPLGTKAGFIGAPIITLLGPHVATDRRHFMQQAVYTWSVKQEGEGDDYTICSHHDVLRTPSEQQHTLLRITLPTSERRTALRDLQAHNINHYTLFGTEDALARTLALRAFLLD